MCSERVSGKQTKDGINDLVCFLQRGVEVGYEGYSEVFKLHGQALVELVLGLLGVVNRRLVFVVVEVSCCHKTIAAVVAATHRLGRSNGDKVRTYGPQAMRTLGPLLGGWRR
jgi:hypothetical protein